MKEAPNGVQEGSAGSLPPARRPRWFESAAFHLLLLGGVSAFCVALSWRRWPNLLTDTGRELYTPWRLSQGAVLYRDVDDFYGPLSQYLNAALFRIFGPGMMVLVTANLVIFGGIVTLLYRLVSEAWDRWAALGAVVFFVMVFGFAQYTRNAGFNYALPYSHETTHGVLVVLALVWALHRWTERPTVIRSGVTGLLFGLTWVLKPEFMFAGGVVIAFALVNAGIGRRGWDPVRWAAAIAGAVAPTALFWLFFLRYYSFAGAGRAVGRAWLNVVATSRFVGDPAQAGYMGLDAPWRHAWHEFAAAGIVVVALLGLTIGVRLMAGRSSRWNVAVGGAALVVIVAVASALRLARWLEMGRVLPGLLLAYVGYEFVRLVRNRGGATRRNAIALRVSLALLGLTLLARMALAARIYQFGYFQAAIAAVVLVAFLLGEFPHLSGRTRSARRFVVAGVIGFLAAGVAILTHSDWDVFRRLMTYRIGSGRDAFYTFNPKIEPRARGVAFVAKFVATHARNATVLVVPEGLLINYLARVPSPVPAFFLYSAATAGGREAKLVQALERNPPKWVVWISEDLSEYGIKTYGDKPGEGGEILKWAGAHYQIVSSADAFKFDYRTGGVMLLLRRGASP